MHGLDKTRLVACSLRDAADWIERVVKEVSAHPMRVRAGAGGENSTATRVPPLPRPCPPPLSPPPPRLTPHPPPPHTHSPPQEGIDCKFRRMDGYLFPHALGESPTPTSAGSALDKELAACHRRARGVLAWCVCARARVCMARAPPCMHAQARHAGSAPPSPAAAARCRAGMSDVEEVDLGGGADVGGITRALRFPKCAARCSPPSLPPSPTCPPSVTHLHAATPTSTPSSTCKAWRLRWCAAGARSSRAPRLGRRVGAAAAAAVGARSSSCVPQANPPRSCPPPHSRADGPVVEIEGGGSIRTEAVVMATNSPCNHNLAVHARQLPYRHARTHARTRARSLACTGQSQAPCALLPPPPTPLLLSALSQPPVGALPPPPHFASRTYAVGLLIPKSQWREGCYWDTGRMAEGGGRCPSRRRHSSMLPLPPPPLMPPPPAPPPPAHTSRALPLRAHRPLGRHPPPADRGGGGPQDRQPVALRPLRAAGEVGAAGVGGSRQGRGWLLPGGRAAPGMCTPTAHRLHTNPPNHPPMPRRQLGARALDGRGRVRAALERAGDGAC